MKTNALYILCCLLLSILTANAQSADGYIFTPEPVNKHYSDIPFSELSVSGGISTMGITAELVTPVSPYFQLRAGLNYFYFQSKSYEGSVDDPHKELRKAFGYKPDMRMNGKLNTFHGHALVDFYPVRGGLFFVSGGLYLGQNKVKLDGYLIDKKGERAVLKDGQEWPTIDFQGNTIVVKNGNVNADVTIGNVVKPYLGLGLGRAISKKKLGFTVELGMMYQGDYTIKQDGIAVNYDFDDSIEYNEKAEKWLKRIKWWPKVSFQLRYRLF